LSLIESSIYFFGYDQTAARLSRARELAERALALKPDLPEGHIALGYYHYRGHKDWNRAIEEFQIAARSRPNQSELLANISYARRRQGRFSEALELMTEALRLDPRSTKLAAEAGITCLSMRRYAEAEELLDRSIALGPDQIYAFVWKAFFYLMGPGDVASSRATLEQITFTNPLETFFAWFGQLLCERDYEAALKRVAVLGGGRYEYQLWFWTQSQLEGVILRLMGRHDEARSRFEVAAGDLERVRDERPDDCRVRVSLAQVYAGLGRREAALREAAAAVALVPIDKDALRGTMPLHGQAMVMAMVGDRDAAVNQVEHLLAIPSWFSPALLRVEPYWDPLRDLPRFQKLLQQPDKVF
jgi:serine/threonine-protein kinase